MGRGDPACPTNPIWNENILPIPAQKLCCRNRREHFTSMPQHRNNCRRLSETSAAASPCSSPSRATFRSSASASPNNWQYFLTSRAHSWAGRFIQEAHLHGWSQAVVRSEVQHKTLIFPQMPSLSTDRRVLLADLSSAESVFRAGARLATGKLCKAAWRAAVAEPHFQQ